jgi:hypothetical protein
LQINEEAEDRLNGVLSLFTTNAALLGDKPEAVRDAAIDKAVRWAQEYNILKSAVNVLSATCTEMEEAGVAPWM